MRVLSLISTLLVLGNTAVTAWGADLTKIDRKIAKEPAYQNKPKYCLIVFGPEAKFRVWLVRDGDVLYVDKNGNGDLTEDGERKQTDGSPLTLGVHTVRRWQIGTITDPQNKANYTDLRVSLLDLDLQLPESARRRIADGGVGEGFEIDVHVPFGNRRLPWSTARWGRNYVAFADRPEDAPIVHFGGPLTMMVDKPPILVGGGIWRVQLARIGTPGLGQGSFAALNSDSGLDLSTDEPALVELQFTDKQGKGQRALAKLTYD
jgi:hypothetical protein